MSDYTPDEEDLVSAYAGDISTWTHESFAEAEANAKRGIAKIKADALLEWARFQECALEASHHALDQDELNTTLAWIDDAKAYALRIEGEA